jgi:hypothetical protein
MYYLNLNDASDETLVVYVSFIFADEWVSRDPEKWIRELMMSYLLSGRFPFKAYTVNTTDMEGKLVKKYKQTNKSRLEKALFQFTVGRLLRQWRKC